MTSQRWFGGMFSLLALLVGLMAPVAGQEKDNDKDKNKEKPKEKVAAAGPSMSWTAFDKGKPVFYQTLETDTEQIMNVQGQEVIQKQYQKFIIEWTPQTADDKSFVVDQKIIGVKMNIDIGGNKISYDSADTKQPNNPMSDFFKSLQSLKLTLVIDPKTLEVTEVKGREEFVNKLGATNPQMKSLLDNILNDKAIKRMAEPTWGAVPGKAVKKGDSWNKTSVLDLGAIGTYTTKMTYTFDGDEKGKDKISVKADLSYKVNEPGKDAPLPFKIISKDTTLASKEGSGTVIFDQAKGRIESSTLKLKLEGVLMIEVAGMQTKVDLTQNQNSNSTLSDTNPNAPATPPETKKEETKKEEKKK